MSEHPHDLLAELVDGTLSGQDLARVEAHLGTCDRCTEEVALSRSAVAALATLPEEAVPFGATREAVRQAARGSRWQQRPAAWRLAGAAAAAAAVIGAVVFVSLRPVSREGADGPTFARSPTEDAPAGAPAPAPAGEAATQEDAETGSSALASAPTFTQSSARLDTERVARRTAEIVADARRALDRGFAPTAVDFYAGFDLGSLPPAAQRALTCVTEGAPDRDVVPFHIEETTFEGDPAYLVAFLAGPAADRPYDRVQVLVADRQTCAIRHFARQRL